MVGKRSAKLADRKDIQDVADILLRTKWTLIYSKFSKEPEITMQRRSLFGLILSQQAFCRRENLAG
jgi:hypothetical protein